MSRDWAEDEPLDKAAETAARTVRAAGQAKQAAEACLLYTSSCV